MFTVTVTAKFSMHAKMKAYRYTFLRPNVWENIRQFLSSTKKMHTKENWFIYSASRCTTALLRAVSGQRVAPDHRVADGGGGQQAESRRDGSFADAVEVNLRGWEGNRRSGEVLYIPLPCCGRCQDNEWRRIIGFLTGVVDSKLSRGEMESFADAIEVKLRCIARRLSSMQYKVDGDTGEAAAGTKKARCLSCDRIVRAIRIESVRRGRFV